MLLARPALPHRREALRARERCAAAVAPRRQRPRCAWFGRRLACRDARHILRRSLAVAINRGSVSRTLTVTF